MSDQPPDLGKSSEPEPPTSPYPQQPSPQYPQYAPGPYGQAGGGYPPNPYGGPGGVAWNAPDHPRATMVLILGVLGLVLCSVCAPFAWVMGKRALNEIDGSQGRLGGRSQTQVGYVLGIVGSVILGISVVLGLVYVVLIIGVLASSG